MNGHRIAKSFFLSLLLALCVFPAAAAIPEPPELKRMLDSATREKYPDADTVTIYDGETVTYQKDGLWESVGEFCVKALTEAGRKQLRKLNFGFSSDYGYLSVEAAEIIRPDGSRRTVDLGKHVSVTISSGQMRSNIFSPSHKTVSLAFPGVELGDAVHVKLNRSGTKTPFPGMFFDSFLLQDDAPLLLAEVTVDAPEALPLRSIAVKDRAGDTVREHKEELRKGRRIRRWTARDVPQLIPEPDMPELRGELQRLLVSTAGSWEEISRWYSELCRPRLAAVDDELKAAVKKLTADKKTDRDKAMALFQFVSQKIRYTGVNNEDAAPGFEPHDVKDTFRQRHGVCRDKAALLTAMLDLAGLKAYPALFYAGKPPVDPEVPASRFNHAVVAWETAPREYQLMDPTFETTAEFFPAYMANQSYLVARPDGEKLRRSPSPPAERSALKIRTEAVCDQEGTYTGTSTLEFTGANDQMYRSAFSRRDRSEMRQIFALQLQKAVPGAQLTRFEVSPSEVRDMSKPLKVVLGYTSEQLLNMSHDAEALPLPELARYFGVLPVMLRAAALDKRRHPLLFDVTAMVEENFKLKLPGSTRIAGIPHQAGGGNMDSGFVWSRELAFGNGTITGSSRAALTRMEIEPERYSEFKSILAGYAAGRSAAPLVRQDFMAAGPEKLAELFPDTDSFLEYDNTSIEINADGSFDTIRDSRRRILNYAGIKRHSEIKIRYNPKWEKVEIRSVVTSPDGKKHYLEPRNIIDMDAPEVSGAPRYPGDKIKVAVLSGVAVGSVVDNVITTSNSGAAFFGRAISFNGSVPAAERTIELIAPGKRLKLSPEPIGVRHLTQSRGRKVRHQWKSFARMALPDEIRQAPPGLFAPTLFISNGDLAEYAQSLDRKLNELAGAPSEKLRRIGETLKAETPLRTVVNIRDYIDLHVRAAGPALNRLPLEYLTSPERTLSDGYGNSADRAAAIAALLTQAGIGHKFVAFSELPFIPENDKLLKKYPEPVFTGVLVYVPELDVYLNDTDRYAKAGSTAHADRIGLDLSAGRLIAIRPQYKLDDEERTTIRLRLHAGGLADLVVTREFYGSSFAEEHRRFAEMTPDECRRHFEKLVAELSPAARPEGTGTFDFSGYPGRISFRCRIGKFAIPTGDYLQFELPGYAAMARTIGAVEAKRQTPALRSRASRNVLKYRIDFPDGYRVVRRRMPDIELGRRNSGYFIEHSSVNRERIDIDAKLVLPVELILPQDCVEVVNLQRELNSLSARRIILKAKTSGRIGQ